jgi:chorismate mutase
MKIEQKSFFISLDGISTSTPVNDDFGDLSQPSENQKNSKWNHQTEKNKTNSENSVQVIISHTLNLNYIFNPKYVKNNGRIL